MNGDGWFLVGLVGFWLAVSASLSAWMFLPEGRREFHRVCPRRAVRDQVAALSFLVVTVGFPVVGWLRRDAVAGPGFDWEGVLPFVITMVYGGLLVVLEWRARRAGEPTWYHWKRLSPPHRPNA